MAGPAPRADLDRRVAQDIDGLLQVGLFTVAYAVIVTLIHNAG